MNDPANSTQGISVLTTKMNRQRTADEEKKKPKRNDQLNEYGIREGVIIIGEKESH